MPSLTLATSQSSLNSTPFETTSSGEECLASSLDQQDEENATVKAKRSHSHMNGAQKSQDDSELRLLAISTHMTELSYAISDIQTRLFEIQELRHKSQSTSEESSGDVEGAAAAIDQSLMTLEEKLEALSTGMKSVGEAMDPLTRDASTPTTARSQSESAALLQKHTALVQEWQAVQEESEVLKEELKEDKWLTVFRTVATQADGMMTSLEKGVRRCQEFILQVRRGQIGGSLDTYGSQASISSPRNDRGPINMETFDSLLRSFEAKKKYYMPACSKVLGIIDKGVQDRVTKNGETLRGHAEAAQRWRNLREQIGRTDSDMERIRKMLLNIDSASDTGSSQDGTFSARNDYLATPPNDAMSRTNSADKSISGSISPLRKFARKITGSSKNSQSPLSPNDRDLLSPSSGKTTIHRSRTSIFSIRSNQPTTPDKERPSHKYTQSLTPESSPGRSPQADLTVKARGSPASNKQRWNSSTKVEMVDRSGTMKGIPTRPPSSAGNYDPSTTSGRRSVSRTSSRPWSPVTSSLSTANSSTYLPMPSFNPPSRSQTPVRPPSQARTSSRSVSRSYTPAPPPTPRARPKTPSHIPMPALNFSPTRLDNGDGHARPFSPAMSTSSSGGGLLHGIPPRPPSRSMIPVPSVQLSSPSRSSTSMSSYSRPDSAAGFRSSAMRAQTPESTLRSRAQLVPAYPGSVGRMGSRTVSATRQPPSSFRDGSASRPPSRSTSRAGAATPSVDGGPLHEYIPGNTKDPLDTEVASIANLLPHGLLVERVDPPLRLVPKEGEEVKAQYAFSTALARKVVTCRLTTMVRVGRAGSDTTRKVMVRVGGGWQDLSQYILNRQAGL